MPMARQTFELHNSFDVVQARQYARELARELGFGLTDQTRIATAVSELAQRALASRVGGSIRFAVVTNGPRRGIECICLGGKELKQSRGLAQGGIPVGLERLVDELAWDEGDGEQLTITIRKWLRQNLVSNSNGKEAAPGWMPA